MTFKIPKNSNLIEMPFRKGGKVEILTGIHKNKVGTITDHRISRGLDTTGACRVLVGKEAIWYKESEINELAPAVEEISTSEFPAVEADIQAGFRLLIDEMEHSHNPYTVSEIGRKLYRGQQKQNKETVRESMIHGHKN